MFHIADRHTGLLPDDTDARARAIYWMFAALNTVEPPIVDCEVVKYLEDGKSWQGERFAMADERICGRLDQLVARLGDVEWLIGTFWAELAEAADVHFKDRDRWWIIDIGGTNLRLIAFIEFKHNRLYVRHIITHAE